MIAFEVFVVVITLAMMLSTPSYASPFYALHHEKEFIYEHISQAFFLVTFAMRAMVVALMADVVSIKF